MTKIYHCSIIFPNKKVNTTKNIISKEIPRLSHMLKFCDSIPNRPNLVNSVANIINGINIGIRSKVSRISLDVDFDEIIPKKVPTQLNPKLNTGMAVNMYIDRGFELNNIENVAMIMHSDMVRKINKDIILLKNISSIGTGISNTAFSVSFFSSWEKNLDIAIEPEKTIDAQIIPDPISAGRFEGFDEVTANIDTTKSEKSVIATTISFDFSSIRMSLPVIIRRILSQFFIIQRDFRILG